MVRSKITANNLFLNLWTFSTGTLNQSLFHFFTVYNDGTTKDLMSLTGTIPVMYEDKTYNIPVCLWIEESYPQTAPICYVRPTREMMVLKGKYISSNGEVLLPYLEEWKNGECDLVSLLQVMVAMFGDFPPVCMQPHPEQKASLHVISEQHQQYLCPRYKFMLIRQIQDSYLGHA
uniref:Zgc:123278 n=1 Tax=Dicentrarchus labrax TaxID=13489 RepID=A0A8P4K2D0_DICLA